MNPFVKRHQDKIAGVLSCFDRVIISGTLPDICYAGVMASYLSYHKIRLFDYPRWAEPLRDELRNHAEHLALEAVIEIEFIRRHKAFRKEDRIQAILATRGAHPGLVHVFAAMESCTAYRPWFDKAKGFGFANVFGRDEDVFLHIEVLRRSGLADLQPGEAV